MSKRFPKAKWVLPQTVDPAERLCFQVEVPNDPQHIAAFRGALWNLASAINWQDDTAHTAKDVAAVWREIYFNVTTCSDCGASGGDDMQWRQNPNNCMQYQYSVDCVNWVTIFDLTDCVNAVVQGATGTTGPKEQPAHGNCDTSQMTLQANSQAVLPVMVTEGDTVTISNATGGATDAVVGGWYCPDGLGYVLGGCYGSPVYDAGDPIPGYAHMAIIARVGSGASAQYLQPVAGVFTIPSGFANAPFAFLVNDGTLADNAGAFTFTADYCASGSVQWCRYIDFTVEDGGFQIWSGQAAWTAGVGWHEVPGYMGVSIRYPFGGSVHLNSARFLVQTDGTQDPDPGQQTAVMYMPYNTQWVRDNHVGGTPGGWLTATTPIDGNSLDLSGYNTHASYWRIVAVEINGFGVNPWGASNC